MFAGRVGFGAVVGFLNGVDAASEGALPGGFQEWLAARPGFGSKLVYRALAEKPILPDGRPEQPWSPENEQHAAAELIGLLDEFFDHRAGDRPCGCPGRR
ncbi:hypothetical protein [Embleya sp. NPDC059259]|uniref:hypothetical protein n=1 Tax=unclassified Embleya TaxID=2699296 RepID=UPI0036A8094C